MKNRIGLGLVFLLGVFSFVACQSTPTDTIPTVKVETSVIRVEPKTPEKIESAKLYSFSNSSPHISVIDTDTKSVIKTADMAAPFTKWGWNDDNNYFDGKNLWLGLKGNDAKDGVVVALDLATLEIVHRIPVGEESSNLYIGKGAKNGLLHVGMQASGKVVVIDTKQGKLANTWDSVPVNGDVVCDADTAVGPDGKERFYYPTRKGDTIVALDAVTGEILKEVATPKGAKPLMHTNHPINGQLWVQEVGSNTNSIYDPVTLDLIKRFPSAKGPVIATFSPDGRYAYIGHFGEPIIQVVRTDTYEEMKRITVGSTPNKIAVHPNGKEIYAIATKEASIVVINYGTWTVQNDRIELGTNPNGFFLLPGSDN
jgi:DNA-binding beta-propeller fold protein YncE